MTGIGTKASPAVYRADIDGLRAVAVLLVLLFHFDLLIVGRAGFIGVDVFFVISGFLITSILKRQLDAGTFGLRDFYAARVRRLAPALLFVLAAVLVAGALTLFQHDLMELARQVLFSQLYVVNIYYWRSINYFGLGTDNVYLLHMWSLAVEEQFYLFYPLGLLLLHRFQRQRFWRWIAVACAVSFVLNVVFVMYKPEATFYLLPTRAWELLAGALVSMAITRRRGPRAVDDVLGAVGLVLIVVAVASYSPGIAFPGTFALLPVTGACALLWSGAAGRSQVSRLLSTSPLTYIGRISYPLYLVHWPVKVFAGAQDVDGAAWPWRLAMFALSVALASGIYHWVEEPVRRRRVLTATRSLIAGYAGGLAATLAIVGLIYATGGLPQRFPDDVSRLAAFVDDRPPPLEACEFKGKPLVSASDFCSIGARGHEPTWLVYGDSHAWATHAAFDQWLAKKGEAGLFKFRHACPPLLGVHLVGERSGCFEFNEAVAAYVAKAPSIATVVLVASWYEAPEGTLAAAGHVRSDPVESLALFRRSFADTLRRYKALDRRIYVWAPVPGATRNVPLSMATARLRSLPLDNEVRRRIYDLSTAFFFDAVHADRSLIDVLFQPADALCDSERCRTTIDGAPAYFDASHLAQSTSAFWVDMMDRAERDARRLP